MSERSGTNKGDRPLILKPADWPAGDHAAWNALFVEGDILDGAGPCAHWAHGSRIKRRQSYGYWLAFLARRGELDEQVDVAGRATPDRVRAFVEGELVRCSPVTAHTHADDLYVVFRAMAPHRDWS
jgi:integrase/recombinase XerD